MADSEDLPYIQGQAELLLIFENQLAAPLKSSKAGIQRMVGLIAEHLPALVVAVNSGEGAAISNAANEFTKRVQVCNHSFIHGFCLTGCVGVSSLRVHSTRP